MWVSDTMRAAQVREIYETAIEEQEEGGLGDEDCKRMCLRYAALERRLGEIDRARAIYVHASSLADPCTDPGFWADWNDFEVKHGNEDTFRCGCGTIAVALAAHISDECSHSSMVQFTPQSCQASICARPDGLAMECAA